MNKILITGRNVKDIELRNNVANFTLAVNRTFKNQSGEYEADFINCVAFGKTAEALSKYTTKGSKLLVEGRIQVRNYEKEGNKVYVTEVVVERVEFLDSKPKEEKPKEDVFAEFGQQVENDNGLELPF